MIPTLHDREYLVEYLILSDNGTNAVGIERSNIVNVRIELLIKQIVYFESNFNYIYSYSFVYGINI